MADPYVIGAGAIVAYLSKDGLEKLLGPTAEYLGGNLKDFTKRRVENIGKIFSAAARKLGTDLDKAGSVPPRVLRDVINEGSYSEDELMIDYFGGVLASSRTQLGRDDRGVRVSKTISSLSAYQLRAHYIIYNSVVALFRGKGFSLNMRDRPNMRVFFPLENFLTSMAFAPDELQQFDSMMRHIFFGLDSESMIEGGFSYGRGVEYYNGGAKAMGVGVVCQPSALGADVFLWAHGKGKAPTDFLFSDEFQPLVDQKLVELSGAVPASITEAKQAQDG